MRSRVTSLVRVIVPLLLNSTLSNVIVPEPSKLNSVAKLFKVSKPLPAITAPTSMPTFPNMVAPSI